MNKLSDKAFFRIAMTITLVVLGLVVLLYSGILPKPDTIPDFVRYQPFFHALLNGMCAILLIYSLKAIKSGRIQTHKKFNLSAFVLSAIFLGSYVVYHYLGPKTSYGGDGVVKYIYFFILITHIAAAAVVLPLILLSFWYALTNKIAKHKKIVRFSYPVWLYVAVTGVIVFIMISPYYRFG
ncbi:MAG: putative membrane protein [Bacteroidia bacterium]|jgi:putative membrane protein|tara:strand:+ start:7990 stop:8532 length:543 start_codon:yes stop_codon:yes gene_type:complete